MLRKVNCLEEDLLPNRLSQKVKWIQATTEEISKNSSKQAIEIEDEKSRKAIIYVGQLMRSFTQNLDRDNFDDELSPRRHQGPYPNGKLHIDSGKVWKK